MWITPSGESSFMEPPSEEQAFVEPPSAEQIVLSKKGGGEWGLEHLPERFRGLLETALSCYRDGRSKAVRAEEAEQFADYMLTEIRKNLGERAEA